MRNIPTDTENITTPLANEDVAKFVIAVMAQIEQFHNDSITKLDSKIAENNNILNNLSLNINNCAVEMVNIKTGLDNIHNDNQEIIKSLKTNNSSSSSLEYHTIKSQKRADDMFERLGNTINDLAAIVKTSMVEKPVIQEIKHKDAKPINYNYYYRNSFNNTATDKWRTKANNDVEKLAHEYGFDRISVYDYVYKNIQDEHNINLSDLRKQRNMRSIIEVIANSDQLRSSFERIISEINKRKYIFCSYDYIVCPNKIKDLAAKLYNKKSVSTSDLKKMYRMLDVALPSGLDTNKILRSIRKQIGGKSITKGFAIYVYPEAYRKLKDVVDCTAR